MLDIKANRTNVLKSLEQCARIAAPAKKSTSAYTECVLLEVESALKASATDLIISVRSACDVEVKSPGRVAVKSDSLLERIKALPGDEFTLAQTEKSLVLKGVGTRRKYEIAYLSADDYPTIAEIPSVDTMTVSAKTMVDLLRSVVHAAHEDPTRHICSIFVEWDCDKLKATSTDTGRLSHSWVVTGDRNKMTALLPLRCARELMSLCSGGDLVLARTDADLFCTVGSTVLSFKTKIEEYPPYPQLIAMAENYPSMKVSSDALLKVLRGLDVNCSDKLGGIDLSLTKGKLELRVANKETGDAEDEIEVPWEGKDWKSQFRCASLIEALDSCGTSDPILSIGDTLDPLVIRSNEDPEKCDFIELIMPRRM